MYEKISNKMAEFILRNGAGRYEYREIYAFGFENLISTIINTVYMFILGYILDIAGETFVYLFFYGALRIYSGGLHKKTHLECILTYSVLAFGEIGIMKLLYLYNPNIGYLLCQLLLIAAVVLVFLFAPVDCENKRLESDEKEIQKRRSRKVIIAEAALIILGSLLGQELFAMIAAGAVFIQSVTLIPIINN